MIYTFYSYKGGVGRTMALANIAQLFFQAGHQVLMIDWDLEAPGLEQYFPINHAAVLEQRGVIDMILQYKETMSIKSDNEEHGTDITSKFEKPEDLYIDIYPKLQSEGKLYLLTAGNRSDFKKYSQSVINFNWKDFYDNWEGARYFEWFRTKVESLADVILIDSRTGVTEMGGICTYHLADMVVLFCSTNKQGMDGTLRMVKDFSRKEVVTVREGRSLKTLVVPARIEKTSELEDLNRFRQKFENSFTPYISDISEKNNNLLESMEIPYVAKYSFEEIIAVLQEKNTEYYEPNLINVYKKIFIFLSEIARIVVDDSTDFVNRVNELSFITNIYCPQYLLISAPMGYGKTRLLESVSKGISIC